MPSPEKMSLPDGSVDAVNQIIHGDMLGGSPPLTSGIGPAAGMLPQGKRKPPQAAREGDPYSATA